MLVSLHACDLLVFILAYVHVCRYNPGVLQPHKWENAMTIDKGSWGYRRNVDISGYLTMAELIKTMVETIR